MSVCMCVWENDVDETFQMIAILIIMYTTKASECANEQTTVVQTLSVAAENLPTYSRLNI